MSSDRFEGPEGQRLEDVAPNSNSNAFEPPVLHQFKNYLTAILGFCELLLMDLPEGAVRQDVTEIRRAATAAIALFPQLSERYRDD